MNINSLSNLSRRDFIPGKSWRQHPDPVSAPSVRRGDGYCRNDDPGGLAGEDRG
jgi:hypothetical protein